jgi:hypothetical protein
MRFVKLLLLSVCQATIPWLLIACAHSASKPPVDASPSSRPAGIATALPPASLVPDATSLALPAAPPLSPSPQPSAEASALPSPLPSSSPELPTPTPLVPASNQPNQLTVTRQDDRKTITASVGERILVRLGSDFRWRLDMPDPSILSPLSATLAEGSQALFVAVRPATLELLATGTANCLPGSACPLFALPFKVELVIR